MNTSQQFRSEIVELEVGEGSLAFWWLGQQTWIVKTANYILAIDPYLKPDLGKRMVPPLLEAQDCDFFDYILCTHEHTDHFDRYTLDIIARLDTNVLKKALIPKHLRDDANKLGLGDDRLILMDGQNEFDDGTLHVTSIPAAHELLEYNQQTGHRWLSYIITVDGFTIYAAGDTCYYDGLLSRLKQQPIDLMLVPINGRDAERYRRGCLGNMTYQEAVDLAGMTRPKLVCPAHFGMFANNTVDVGPFVDYLTAKFPEQRYWAGPPHQKASLDKRQ